MTELAARHEQVETTFRQIDKNRFTGVIYRSGKSVARCKIMLGGMMRHGITYSNSDSASDNSCNEYLQVGEDDQGLYLVPSGMLNFGANRNLHLTFEGAAEHLWNAFIEPLQRKY